MELAANWIDAMWKDIREASREHTFDRLNERWRWNLYVRPIRAKKTDSQGDLLARTKQLYERFVGEPFLIRTRPHRSHQAHHRRRHSPVLSAAVPTAWLISEIMKRSSALEVSGVQN
jgi:hypothetical protein